MAKLYGQPQTSAFSYDALTASQATAPGVLAMAINNTQVVQNLSANNVQTAMDGVSIFVPVSARPVVIQATASCQQTAIGAGVACLSLGEWTDGTYTGSKMNWTTPLPNPSGTLGSFSSFFQVGGDFPLGQVTSPRWFRLQAYMLLETGSAATIKYMHGNSLSQPTMIKAVAL